MTLQHTRHSLQRSHYDGRNCTLHTRKSNGKRPYYTRKWGKITESTRKAIYESQNGVLRADR